MILEQAKQKLNDALLGLGLGLKMESFGVDWFVTEKGVQMTKCVIWVPPLEDLCENGCG